MAGLLDYAQPAQTYSNPQDTSGGMLAIPNLRVTDAFGALPGQGAQPPQSLIDYLLQQQQQQAQPQSTPQGAEPASLPMQGRAQAAPSPSAQPQQGGGGFWSGLGNFINNNPSTLMALAGGLASGGIGGAFSAAAPVALKEHEQNLQSQAQMGAYQAVKAAGGSEAQARAAAANPDVFKALVPDLFGAPKVVKTGTDILGHDIMKLQQGGKFSEIPGQSGSASGGVASNIDQSKPIYDQLPKPQQDIVDQMLAGRKAPPASFALKTPYWQTLQAAASEKAAQNGGMFDETTWGQRFAAAKDLSPQGKSGQTINALDTVQGHIEKLSNAAEQLDNGGWKAWNAIRNGVATNTPLDSQRTKNLQSVMDARKAVVNEMGRAYKAGHLSDAEVKDWSALFNEADSKIKMRQALADFTELLNTKRDALVGQYKSLDVPFKGENAAQNERVTKLVHDRNADVALTATPSAQAPTGQDQQALTWANSHPNDPRAALIKKRLGVQ